MDAVVIRAFCDKNNLTDEYQPGDVFSGTAERIHELVEGGFVEAHKKPSKKKAELLEEAEAGMTNAELADAIAQAKKSPAKPRRKKAQ